MKIYNVIWSDRHVETTATPFLVLEDAIEWARARAVNNCVFTEDFEEPGPQQGGYIMCVIPARGTPFGLLNMRHDE